MNLIEQGEAHISGKLIDLGGPVITWVGEMPWINGFAYGDEDGWLRFSSLDGPLKFPAPFRVVESERAINQVAFSVIDSIKYIGASTASNVAIHQLDENGVSVRCQTFKGGGHGIYATQSGEFVVPLGPGGLTSLFPGPHGRIIQRVLKPGPDVRYCYSMCRIGYLVERELWACAGRSGGLMVVVLDDRHVPTLLRSFRSATRPTDYVSVYGVGTTDHPYAYVSLSRDGLVDLGENIITDKTPVTWHFPGTEGVAYSLFAAEGDLFILTSKGLYVCFDIVRWFLEGKLTGGERVLSKVRYLAMEMIDCALLYGRWLMILQPDRLVRLDVRDIVIPGQSITVGQSVEREASAGVSAWADITLETVELAVA